MRYNVMVDCDEVLNNLIDRTCQIFNERYNSNISPETFTQYDIYKCLSFEDAEKFSALWHERELWDSLSPIHHSQWGVKKLIDDGFNVYIATSTHYNNFPWKMEWIKYYLPFVKESHVICIGDKSALNADVMIDDCAENLINNIRCHRVLVTRPWNTDIHDDIYDIKRCSNWDEIVEAVEECYKNDKELMDD